MRGKIITVIIGLAISAAGFYLLVKWWDGNAWQRFLSGAMALGGLGAVWGVIKGENKAASSKQSKGTTATTADQGQGTKTAPDDQSKSAKK
jgi:hypothetical protein